MVSEHTLRPESFINPSLPLYATMPAVWLQQTLGGFGMLRGRAADPLLAGRLLGALAGALAVFVLGTAARREHPALSFWPALLLAVTPGFVNLCHFATPESWLMLGAAATLALALAHLRGRAPAWALGLALGLTMSTKHTALALLVPCVVAVWMAPASDDDPRRRRQGIVATLALGVLALAAAVVLFGGAGAALAARLHFPDPRLLPPESARAFVRAAARAAALGGLVMIALGALALRGPSWARAAARPALAVLLLAAAAGFVIGTPYALVDPPAVLSGMAFNYETRQQYKGLTGAATSFGPYAALLADALTAPLLAAALVGLLIAAGRAARRDGAPAVLALFALTPYLLVAGSGHQALRFLAPLFPAAAWLAALALAEPRRPRTRRFVRALVAGRALLASVLVVRLFFVDSRLQAQRWLQHHVAPGETIDLIANSPGYAPAPPPGTEMRVVPTLSREMAPADRFAEAAARYAVDGARWLVLTASYYERFLDHPEQRPERAAFFTRLLDGRGGYEVAARFRQRGWLRPPAEFVDPEIVVLQKRGSTP